jgi:hypothetical protein
MRFEVETNQLSRGFAKEQGGELACTATTWAGEKQQLGSRLL